MEDCIFCKIAAGEIPVSAVYEDDYVIAFDDIAPQAPIHTLVVPKKHYLNLSDNVPTSLLGELFAAVPEVAKVKGVAQSGYRVIVNNGDDAQQSVPHLHVHILGGRKMAAGMVDFADE